MPSAGAQVKAYGSIQQDSVATNEGTTSGSFTNLATTGPSVTVELDDGQDCLFVVEASAFMSAAGVNGAVFTVEIAGPGSSDLAAADDNGCETGNLEWTPGTKHVLFTATEAGAHVATMKYRRITSDTANFKHRRLTAIPQP